MTLEPVDSNTWDINYDAPWLCLTDDDCAKMLPNSDVHKCGELIDYGMPISIDKPET